MSKQYYWMAVTPDKYELPLAVAVSSRELSELLGVANGTILALEAGHRSGKNTGRKIIKVRQKTV